MSDLIRTKVADYLLAVFGMRRYRADGSFRIQLLGHVRSRKTGSGTSKSLDRIGDSHKNGIPEFPSQGVEGVKN